MQASGGNTRDRDRALVVSVLAGKPHAIGQFIQEVSGTVWTSCRALSSCEGEARDNFIAIMQQLRESGFAAFLDYDGRSTLKTFTSLVVRDLQCRNLVQLFGSDSRKAWCRFEQLFGADIRRLIHRRVPAHADELRQDFFQSVCLALVEQNYRRITAYGGKGSFSGYILRCVDNILRDEIRCHVEPRLRLPAAIARLGELERELFRLLVRNRIAARTELLAQELRLRLSRNFEAAEIESAVQRVRKHAEHFRDSDHLNERPAEPSPEDRLITAAEDERLSAAIEVLTQAVHILPDDERLYLMLMLQENPPPPRELARLMRRPVEDIYAFKQRVLKKLRDSVAVHSAVKNWLTPV